MSGLPIMVRRSLRQHALSSGVTIGAVALACGLVMAVFAIESQTRRAFAGGEVGFDAVLGARGSKLQLVLNTVFHLETSPGNIPWSLYEAVSKDPRVALAIPYALGDNYRGFRIVGTSPELFSEFEIQRGRKFALAAGRYFDAGRMEAVVGSFAAQRTGLKVGDVFNPYHGLYFDETARHSEQYVVVGVLEATNSPSDRVIWIPLDGVFYMQGHVLRGEGKPFAAQLGEQIPDSAKEVSAVMLKLKNPQAGFQLDQLINKQGKVATLAWPIGQTMADLFDKLGWMSRVLQLVAGLVVLVSAAAILAGLYNTINERRREFAILRALGARRSTVFSAILLESSTIALLGALLGYVVYAAIMTFAALIIRRQTGVVVDIFAPIAALWLTPIGMVLAGALVGVVPAIKAYATDVATNLSPQT